MSALRVKLTTATAPTAGSFSVTVRKNGGNTLLTCQVTATGACNATGTVTFATGDPLAVRVSNNFTGSGLMGYTYTLLFD